MKISSPFFLSPKPVALAVSALMTGLMVTACGGDSDNTGPVPVAQPVISAQAKPVVTVEGKQLKDLNGNGKLDPYEDWRLTVEQRVADLVSRMSLEEKTGMMMINDMNAGCAGAVTATAADYIGTQKMTRFILRSKRCSHRRRVQHRAGPGWIYRYAAAAGDLHERDPGHGRSHAAGHSGGFQGQRAQSL